MFAAREGHSRVVRILLTRKANVSIEKDGGCTALHMSAEFGHLSVTVDLIKACAELDAKKSFRGRTPLHFAAYHGHSPVIAALIKAGADVDSRDKTGVTPLWVAASVGPDATTELLRAKANPLLSAKISEGFDQLPLDVAAHEGHARVVHELISQVGIEGCAGASGGVGALQAATMAQHLDIMAMLMDAGVADSGRLLRMAAGRGLVAIVKLLLQQRHRGRDTSDGEGEYVKLYDGMGMTPLFYSIDGDGDFHYLISPKVVRLLIDAGADTSSAFLIAEPQGGEVLFSDTPLAYTNHCIREKQVGGVNTRQLKSRCTGLRLFAAC